MFGSPIGLSPILLRRRRHRLAQQKYELYLNICDWGNLNHSLISCKHSAVQGSKDGWCKLLICISYISMNTCNFSFILKSFLIPSMDHLQSLLSLNECILHLTGFDGLGCISCFDEQCCLVTISFSWLQYFIVLFFLLPLFLFLFCLMC